MPLSSPGSLREEHAEILHGLRPLGRHKNRTGQAVKDLLNILRPHLAKEERIALPILGVLRKIISKNESENEAQSIMEIARELEKEYSTMLSEHGKIVKLIGKGLTAAKKDKVRRAINLLEALAHHARVEEEILYPTAILAGMYETQNHSRSQLARSDVIVTSFDEKRKYDEKTFSPVPVYGTDRYRVILTYTKAGQFIPIHTANIDLIFMVNTGTGEIVAGTRREEIKPGSLVVIPAGVRRGLKAHTDLEALHIVSPPPSQSDQEEVFKKLQLGQFD